MIFVIAFTSNVIHCFLLTAMHYKMFFKICNSATACDALWITHAPQAVELCLLSLTGTLYTAADAGDPRLQNDLLCVEWDVKPYTLTHTH